MRVTSVGRLHSLDGVRAATGLPDGPAMDDADIPTADARNNSCVETPAELAVGRLPNDGDDFKLALRPDLNRIGVGVR